MGDEVKVLAMVRAVHDFAGGEGQLSLSKGDVLCIVSKEASGWWEGLSDGSFGWIPSNHVEVISSATLASAMESTPKTVRLKPADAAALLDSLAAQEEKQKEEKNTSKGGGGGGGRLKGLLSPRRGGKLFAREGERGLFRKRSKTGGGKEKKELHISGPVEVEHRTHVTSEEAADSERLMALAPDMGITHTTAERVIWGDGEKKEREEELEEVTLEEGEEDSDGTEVLALASLARDLDLDALEAVMEEEEEKKEEREGEEDSLSMLVREANLGLAMDNLNLLEEPIGAVTVPAAGSVRVRFPARPPPACPDNDDEEDSDP